MPSRRFHPKSDPDDEFLTLVQLEGQAFELSAIEPKKNVAEDLALGVTIDEAAALSLVILGPSMPHVGRGTSKSAATEASAIP